MLGAHSGSLWEPPVPGIHHALGVKNRIREYSGARFSGAQPLTNSCQFWIMSRSKRVSGQAIIDNVTNVVNSDKNM